MSARNCLSNEELAGLFLNETRAGERERSLDHIALCPVCSFKFDILSRVRKEVEPAVERFGREASSPFPGRLLRRAARKKLMPPGRQAFSRPALRFAFGALGVLLIAAAGYFAVDRFAGEPVLRSAESGLKLLEPVGRLDRVPEAFRWSPVPKAESYILDLIDGTLRTVFRSTTFIVTDLVIPADVRSQLVPGRTYLWTVTAYDAEGDLLLSRSGHFRLD